MKTEKLMKWADRMNVATAVFGIFILAPTWFEPFEKFNGVAISTIALLAWIQVLLLRKYISNA